MFSKHFSLLLSYLNWEVQTILFQPITKMWQVLNLQKMPFCMTRWQCHFYKTWYLKKGTFTFISLLLKTVPNTTMIVDNSNPVVVSDFHVYQKNLYYEIHVIRFSTLSTEAHGFLLVHYALQFLFLFFFLFHLKLQLGVLI